MQRDYFVRFFVINGNLMILGRPDSCIIENKVTKITSKVSIIELRVLHSRQIHDQEIKRDLSRHVKIYNALHCIP